jgi:putative tryptophan/tyrosine transport system substrate-binding protein
MPVRRREFTTLVGAAVATWPLVARAQHAERVRRIGVLVPAAANDPVWQTRIGAFQQALALSGWIIGRNVQIDIRWATTDAAAIRREAEELAALAPDVIFAAGHSSAAPLLQATRTVPIVFALVQDAVAAGFVDSLARPGGNATGFSSWEFSMGAKWLELLKQIAPGLTRVVVLRDASQGFAVSQFVAIQTVAPSLGVEVIPINMRDAGEIERSVATFCALSEWRSDPDPQRGGGTSSRSDPHAGGPPQTTGGLLGTLVRRCRRPDLLWA